MPTTTKTFDESKIRRNPDGTFADKDNRHTPPDLPAFPGYDRPVGEAFLHDADDIAANLYADKQEWAQLPAGGCYRINDMGDYVSEQDWDRTWQDHELESKAWALSTLGQAPAAHIAGLTGEQIENTYDTAADDLYTEKPADPDDGEDDDTHTAPVDRSTNWDAVRSLPDATADTDRLMREDNQAYAGMDMEQVIDHKHYSGFGHGADTSYTARNRLMTATDPTSDKDAIGTLSVAMDYSPKYESLSNLNMMMPNTDVDYHPDHWESSMDALVRQAASGHGVNRENTRRMVAALNQVADYCHNDDNQASLAMAQMAVGHLALGERHRATREAREALDYVDKRSDTYTAKTRHIVQAILDHTTDLD